MDFISMTNNIITGEEINAVNEVLHSKQLGYGKVVEKFEYEFATKMNCDYAVACNSGTSALHMALISNSIGQGDEVITTCFSFISTANSILMCGAKPVFVDIDDKTLNMNIDQIEDKITNKTKAILVVHLFGNPCDMITINKIAYKYNLRVIEDCCQAHFAEILLNDKDIQYVGTFGDCGCFSFYPTNNMYLGEGGMVTTNDFNIYKKLKMIRNHGQAEKYVSTMLGYNYMMTNISASIGLCQLKHITKRNMFRHENARNYYILLKDCKYIKFQEEYSQGITVYNQYSIRIKDICSISRNRLKDELFKHNIGSDICYPILMPHQAHIASREVFEIADKVKDEILSIPVHFSLTKNEIDYIGNTIKQILNEV